MGEDGLEGRRAVAGERKQQRGLKPAAMLVGAFEINVRLPIKCGVRSAGCGMAKFRAAHQDGAGGTAGIDPDVERVVGFGGGGCAFPIGGFHQSPQFGGGFFEPDVRAVLFDQGGGVADDLGVEDGVALRVVERGDGHAPGALAGDAPVGTGFDRAFDAVFAPIGNPIDIVDGVQGRDFERYSEADRLYEALEVGKYISGFDLRRITSSPTGSKV